MLIDNEATLLGKLFDGRRDAYGVGKGNVERTQSGEPWSDEAWHTLLRAHLEGVPSADLGIYLVRDDDTVTFAAIDIDEPDKDLALEIATTMPTGEAPAWIEKSRSGNYHVFVFFDEPLEAWAALAVLRGVIIACGCPDLECYPKQGGLREGMVGNYISIPFHGKDRPIVAWSGCKHEWPTSRSEWFTIADTERVSAEAWRRRGKALGGKPRSEERSSEFGQRNSLHQCAQYIFDNRFSNPLVPGHRAIVLFSVAKQLANCRHYSESEAVDFVDAINGAGTDPVTYREVKRFVRNAFDGGFTSTGCDEGAMLAYVSPDCKIANG